MLYIALTPHFMSIMSSKTESTGQKLQEPPEGEVPDPDEVLFDNDVVMDSAPDIDVNALSPPDGYQKLETDNWI